MALLLYLIIWGTFGAGAYHYGLHWWMFPVAALLVAIVKVSLNADTQHAKDLPGVAKFLLVRAVLLYAVIFSLYVITADKNYDHRAVEFLEFTFFIGKYFLNFVGVMVMLLLFGSEGSSSGRRSRSEGRVIYADHDDEPINMRTNPIRTMDMERADAINRGVKDPTDA
ncbi:MAG: hypothetical protein ACRBBN_12705 [Methyloligellaceae bacterium]